MGLVASMHRPGGNLTGVTGLNAPLLPKKLELLHELAPAATNIAALVNTANPNAETLSQALRAAASGCSFIFCRRPTTVTSTRSLQLQSSADIGGNPF
jgi:ABC-type uncharacterized transport system substrate-binding protein